MSNRNYSPLLTCMSGKITTGMGLAQYIEDWKILSIQMASAASGGATTLTVKFQISNADTCPDFSSAASATNPWTYAQVVNLDTGAAVNGVTGIAFAGAEAVYNLELNINGAKWFNANITAYTQGALTIKAKGFNNE